MNGEVLHIGEVVGDISERDMRRIQIRETILSHFEKEEKQFAISSAKEAVKLLISLGLVAEGSISLQDLAS